MKEATPEDLFSKEKREGIKNFVDGAEQIKIAHKKIITDLLNKYKSHLRDAKYSKLTKIINTEEVLKLEAKIEVLIELQGKL